MDKSKPNEIFILIISVFLSVGILGVSYWFFMKKPNNSDDKTNISISENINQLPSNTYQNPNNIYESNSVSEENIIFAESPFAYQNGSKNESNLNYSDNVTTFDTPKPPSFIIASPKDKEPEDLPKNPFVIGLFSNQNGKSYGILADEKEQIVVTDNTETKWGKVNSITAKGIIIDGKFIELSNNPFVIEKQGGKK